MERQSITHRTRAGLASNKAAGAIVDNRTNLAEASAKGATPNRAGAAAFAANVLPIIRQGEAAGVKCSRAIAAALNAHGARNARVAGGIPARCGKAAGQWVRRQIAARRERSKHRPPPFAHIRRCQRTAFSPPFSPRRGLRDGGSI
jgi:hypothetical protein